MVRAQRNFAAHRPPHPRRTRWPPAGAAIAAALWRHCTRQPRMATRARSRLEGVAVVDAIQRAAEALRNGCRSRTPRIGGAPTSTGFATCLANFAIGSRHDDRGSGLSGYSPIKRTRATKAEVEARREAPLDIIEAG